MNLSRINQKLATTFAAAALARKFGILPWKNKEMLAALLACEESHIILVGKRDSYEKEPLYAFKLNQYIDANSACFIDYRKRLPDEPCKDDAKLFLCIHKKREELLMPYAIFEDIMGGKANARAARNELARLGAIAVVGGGAGGKRFVVKRPVCDGKNGPRKSFIAIYVDRL